MAEPHGRQVCTRGAGTGSLFDTHDSVFAAIALRSLHAQLVQGFEIMFRNRWDSRACLCRLDEGLERLDQVGLLIRHLLNLFRPSFAEATV